MRYRVIILIIGIAVVASAAAILTAQSTTDSKGYFFPPVCASCHKIMDPIGFALENFDLTGKWRTNDGPRPIDASGVLVDGTRLDGPASLRNALLTYQEQFVRTVTSKLMTYAVGRATQYYDMPAVRAIARQAALEDYRFSSLIVGVVKSAPFQMRMKRQEGRGGTGRQ